MVVKHWNRLSRDIAVSLFLELFTAWLNMAMILQACFKKVRPHGLLRSFPDLEFEKDKLKLCLTDTKGSNMDLPPLSSDCPSCWVETFEEPHFVFIPPHFVEGGEILEGYPLLCPASYKNNFLPSRWNRSSNGLFLSNTFLYYTGNQNFLETLYFTAFHSRHLLC